MLRVLGYLASVALRITARRREDGRRCLLRNMVSLCEQGSKVVCRHESGPLDGPPVRTGVEGSLRPWLGSPWGSPCANRGRRRVLGIAFALRVVSLCEQGSKASLQPCPATAPVSLYNSSTKEAGADVLQDFLGLPVRTGVEVLHGSPREGVRWSPCANRGRRIALYDKAGALQVSLCEQGSKGSSRSFPAGPSGLPVRTGVEGFTCSSPRQTDRSPCANRGRRMGRGAGLPGERSPCANRGRRV